MTVSKLKMKEKFSPWFISGIKDNKYYIKILIDSCSGLEITFADGTPDTKKERNQVKLKFGLVESYRFCDEHSRLELYKKLSSDPESGFLNGNLYFEVKNSEYIRWLHKSSSGITEEFDLRHYILMDGR